MVVESWARFFLEFYLRNSIWYDRNLMPPPGFELGTLRNNLSFYKSSPFKNLPNFIEKKNLRNFLTKLKFNFFLIFFSKDVLITLLRGPKTMRKIYRVVFEKLRNSWKIFRKKSRWWFWRNILKKRIFRFFSANIPKDVQIHIF